MSQLGLYQGVPRDALGFLEPDTAGCLRGTFFSCACAMDSPLQSSNVDSKTAQNLTACRPMGQALRRLAARPIPAA